jgi:thymidylate synthase
LGEFLWYLAGSDDPGFILPYISAYAAEVTDEGIVNGAYGPRLLSSYGLNQVTAVIDILRRKPASRRAVIQIYAASDLLIEKEVPCTTTLQFFVRSERLQAIASLRSNDAYLGLPHDAFCFTMLQEMIARSLGVEVGEYIQLVGSFHLYDKHEKRAERYIQEGHHRLAEMPAMPPGDAFEVVPIILGHESRIRTGDRIDPDLPGVDPYWADLIRLIQVHFASDDSEYLDALSASFADPMYRMYLDDRRGRQPPSCIGAVERTDR